MAHRFQEEAPEWTTNERTDGRFNQRANGTADHEQERAQHVSILVDSVESKCVRCCEAAFANPVPLLVLFLFVVLLHMAWQGAALQYQQGAAQGPHATGAGSSSQPDYSDRGMPSPLNPEWR